MRILIANDDGIDAPGIALLRRATSRVATDIWVVAPERKWTAASHHLSFDRDLTLTRREKQVHALDGTPADCVVAAMTVLFRDGGKPDLVLSGVNDGRNAAEDAAYSGTLSIAREASFWDVPAIGFSRTKGGTSEERDVAALAALIDNLWQRRAAWSREGAYLSVNLPKELPADDRPRHDRPRQDRRRRRRTGRGRGPHRLAHPPGPAAYQPPGRREQPDRFRPHRHRPALLDRRRPAGRRPCRRSQHSPVSDLRFTGLRRGSPWHRAPERASRAIQAAPASARVCLWNAMPVGR